MVSGKFKFARDGKQKKNKRKIQNSQEYFNRNYVKKTGTHSFAVGNTVLINIKGQIKDNKNVVVR